MYRIVDPDVRMPHVVLEFDYIAAEQLGRVRGAGTLQGIADAPYPGECPPDAVALHQSADLMAAKWRVLARAEQRAACHATDAQPSLQGGQLEIE
jgi:hypothetical protein